MFSRQPQRKPPSCLDQLWHCFLCITLVSIGFAQKGAPKDNSPNSQASGQTPNAQSGSPFFETQMLAYGSVNQLAYAIAHSVCASNAVNPGSTIVIFDQASYQNLQAWQAFKASASALQLAYGTIDPNPTTPILALDASTAAAGPVTVTIGSTLIERCGRNFPAAQQNIDHVFFFVEFCVIYASSWLDLVLNNP